MTGSRLEPSDALQRLEQKVAGAAAIHFDDFFGGLHVVSHPPTLDAYREYRAGLEIFWSDYGRAAAHLENALARDPDFLLPQMIMCFVHGNLGQPERAEAVLARMEEQLSRLSPGEHLLVEFLRAFRERRLAESFRVLQDLDRLVPSSLFVTYNLMQHAVMMNRPRAAVDVYLRRAVGERTLRHSIGSLRYERALDALHMLGEYELELQHSAVAQRYTPGDLRFLKAEGRALVALDRRDEALRVIERSLATPSAGRAGAYAG